MTKEIDESSMRKNAFDKLETGYQEFMQEIEEDPTIRSSINLYKNRKSLQHKVLSKAASAAPSSILTAESIMKDEAEDDDEIPEIDIAGLFPFVCNFSR